MGHLWDIPIPAFAPVLFLGPANYSDFPGSPASVGRVECAGVVGAS